MPKAIIDRKTYWTSWLTTMRPFRNVRTLVMFIGYPRSGHSLIGAILDAHPNMLVSHELDLLAYVRAGYNKRQIFHLIRRRSREFASGGAQWMGYNYKIDGLYQGTCKELRVIGDKRGSNTTRHLMEDPGLLERISAWGVDLKLIHIVRNPYDNITTCMRRRESKQAYDFTQEDLIRKISHHFDKVATIDRIRAKKVYGWFEMKHEDFIEKPVKGLRDLCTFLEIPAPDDYIEQCASIVFKKASSSRFDTDKWNDHTKTLVADQILEYDFLKDYTWD